MLASQIMPVYCCSALAETIKGVEGRCSSRALPPNQSTFQFCRAGLDSVALHFSSCRLYCNYLITAKNNTLMSKNRRKATEMSCEPGAALTTDPALELSNLKVKTEPMNTR